MIKNNRITLIISLIIISIIILILPTMSLITTYINPKALHYFHWSLLLLILIGYIFINIFRTKLFVLPTIAFVLVAIVWFMFYSLSQGIDALVPSFSFVMFVTVINIALVVPYIVFLVKDYKELM